MCVSGDVLQVTVAGKTGGRPRGSPAGSTGPDQGPAALLEREREREKKYTIMLPYLQKS